MSDVSLQIGYVWHWQSTISNTMIKLMDWNGINYSKLDDLGLMLAPDRRRRTGGDSLPQAHNMQ